MADLNNNDHRPGDPDYTEPIETEGRPVDEASSEYHYIKPESTRLYADADYVPQSESTAPPRYYVPPEKKTVTKEKKPKKPGSGMWWKVSSFALVCALLGGIAGGAIAGGAINRELLSTTASPTQTTNPSGGGTSNVTLTAGGKMTPAQIYDMACEQTVGITTEVTSTNYFGQTTSAAVSGSGFVIGSDGYIMTNYHVISYAYQYDYAVSVLLYDGSSYEAKIVGVDESNDLAVLKIDATGMNAVTFGDSDEMSVGDSVYAVGNPLGELAFTMTGGSVSALDRAITTADYSSAVNMFQFDAAINSGNSGGPVYNANGEVIGVATAKYSKTGVEGLSFAIPSNDAKSIGNDLMTKGYVTGKASMGVSIDQNYTSVYSQYYNLPEGAYVKYVNPESAAEKAGIAAGDIITKVGEKDVLSYSDLTSAIKQFHAGDEAEVVVYRSGQSLTLTITFDESKPASDVGSQQSGSQGFGSGQSLPHAGGSSYSFG